MIHIDSMESGKIEFRGDRVSLIADACTMLRALRDENVIDDEDIDKIVELVRKPQEELEKEALDSIEKHLDLLNALLELFSKVNGKDKD